MINPFMSTSNQSYGVNVKDLKTCSVFHQLDNNQDSEAPSSECSEPSLAFLYTRESDRIGAEVRESHSSLAKAFEKPKPNRKWQCKRSSGKGQEDSCDKDVHDCEGDGDGDGDDHGDDGSLRNKMYKHEPKTQNPLYTTTANDIGLKQPHKSANATKRYARSQNFSKSFNRIMFQDQGLNTSLLKSNVHERLDHFV